jgi:uridine phosphorylase
MSSPLEEFDADPIALMDPSRHRGRAEVPPRVVLCFFAEVMEELTAGLTPAYRLKWEHGHHDVYVIERDGRPLTICHPGCGAPLAAANLEVLIALGCDRFVVVGGAGTLVAGFDVGHPVVVTDALRDEGTSWHYLPPESGRYVLPAAGPTEAIARALEAAGVPFERGRTWTTDGLWRETRGKVASRRAEGCLTVEMEASALFAVARFRGVEIGQLLYCGDDLSAPEWDHRSWDGHTSVRRHLFDIGVDAALSL